MQNYIQTSVSAVDTINPSDKILLVIEWVIWSSYVLAWATKRGALRCMSLIELEGKMKVCMVALQLLFVNQLHAFCTTADLQSRNTHSARNCRWLHIEREQQLVFLWIICGMNCVTVLTPRPVIREPWKIPKLLSKLPAIWTLCTTQIARPVTISP